MSETKKPSEKPIVMIKLDEIYQSREYKTLDDIFSNDSTGLLDDTPISTYRRLLIFIEFKILIVLTGILKTK